MLWLRKGFYGIIIYSSKLNLIFGLKILPGTETQQISELNSPNPHTKTICKAL